MVITGDCRHILGGFPAESFDALVTDPPYGLSKQPNMQEVLRHWLAGDVTGGRQEGSAGLNSPRAGAGRTSGAKNTHPTVKPTELMRWLCRLVAPPRGWILDPFAGSGSTGRGAVLEGFEFAGVELSDEYAQIARARIDAALD